MSKRKLIMDPDVDYDLEDAPQKDPKPLTGSQSQEVQFDLVDHGDTDEMDFISTVETLALPAFDSFTKPEVLDANIVNTDHVFSNTPLSTEDGYSISTDIVDVLGVQAAISEFDFE